MSVTTIMTACLLVGLAMALLAVGLIADREKKALGRHGCRHSAAARNDKTV